MEADSQDIYDQAVAEQTENVPETPVEAPVEAKETRVRDEKGRFAPTTPEPSTEVAQEPVTQPQAETQAEPDARVPS